MFQYWELPIRRMPYLPLVRLLYVISDLIVIKNGLIQWYHRQLMEVAEHRYKFKININSSSSLIISSDNKVHSNEIKPKFIFNEFEIRFNISHYFSGKTFDKFKNRNILIIIIIFI